MVRSGIVDAINMGLCDVIYTVPCRFRNRYAASPDHDLIGSDHDLVSLFEHDLRANATRLPRGKTGSRFALTRPFGSGSCSRKTGNERWIWTAPATHHYSL